MKNKKVILGVALALISLSSCKNEGCTDPAATNYNVDADTENGSCIYEGELVPETYNFDNVSYSGQTVRLKLLAELETKISEATTSHVTEQDLLDIYENNNALFADIASSKNLSGKTATEADVLVRAWFSEIDSLSEAGAGYTTADNVDLKQMIGKVLMGGVFLNQALDDYLVAVNTDDNSTVTEGKGTDMEHHFDEAFGYFGAMRNYNNYSDDENKSPGEFDANSDGNIDPSSEKNFYFAFTAVKRDLGSAALGSDATDYSRSLFNAWLTGRHGITNQDYTSRDEAIATIKLDWQKIIAATTVHYINDFTADVTNASSQEDINKHYAEMKAYFMMLSFVTGAEIESDYDAVMTHFGDSPDEFTNNTALLANLETARDLIQAAYSFTDTQAAAW
ncbi:DUF4856 domain-containing protein [Flavobacteriales bacterium]|nr:DUF4856 domain-containing protein [Flavobacteriales bacterium]